MIEEQNKYSKFFDVLFTGTPEGDDVEPRINIKKIISHANCADGNVAALLAKLVYPQAELVPLQYQTPAYTKLKAEPGLLFVDFSPPRERAQEFADVGTVVIDHHASAKEVVEMMGAQGFYETGPGISGASLVFRIFSGLISIIEDSYEFSFGSGLKWLVQAIAARDSWVTKPVCDGHFTHNAEGQPYDSDEAAWRDMNRLQGLFKRLDITHFKTFEQAADFLEEIVGNEQRTYETTPTWSLFMDMEYEKKQQQVQQAVETALVVDRPFPDILPHRKVLVINRAEVISDAAKLLQEKHLKDGITEVIVVAFFYVFEPGTTRLVIDLRSTESFNSGEFAKQRGGGGHKTAAGFSIPGFTPYSPFQLLQDLFYPIQPTEKPFETRGVWQQIPSPFKAAVESKVRE